VKLLHIIATPRHEKSNTLRISNEFLEVLRAKHPDLELDILDLFESDLPSAAGDNIEAKYHLMAGLTIDQQHEESWKQIESLIEHFLSADMYLMSSPMWNFHIPYALKYYIDAIVQPGYLFRYKENGQAEGLAVGKKMVCITSRGGNYAPGTPFHAYDFQEPYLKAIFGFIGITDIQFINANTMDMTRELREANINSAIEEAKQLATTIDWQVDETAPVKESPLGLKPPAVD
jgi:FMN-dependent NADH-azoreductase